MVFRCEHQSFTLHFDLLGTLEERRVNLSLFFHLLDVLVIKCLQYKLCKLSHDLNKRVLEAVQNSLNSHCKQPRKVIKIISYSSTLPAMVLAGEKTEFNFTKIAVLDSRICPLGSLCFFYFFNPTKERSLISTNEFKFSI